MTGVPESFTRFWNAADELAASAVRPTLRKMLEKVGSGRVRDVSRTMEIWRPRRQPLPDVSAALPDGLLASARQLWQSTYERAMARVAEERAALATTTANVEAHREEVTKFAALFESQRDELRTQLKTASKERDAASESVRKLEAQVTALEELCAERLQSLLRGSQRPKPKTG